MNILGQIVCTYIHWEVTLQRVEQLSKFEFLNHNIVNSMKGAQGSKPHVTNKQSLV